MPYHVEHLHGVFHGLSPAVPQMQARRFHDLIGDAEKGFSDVMGS
jgi:hypothetical protein